MKKETKFYSIVAYCHVVVCDNEAEMFNHLYYWQEPYCEVYVVNTMEEVQMISRQSYTRLFYSSPNHFGAVALDLPASGCYAVQSTYTQKDDIAHFQQAPVLQVPAFTGGIVQGGGPVLPMSVEVTEPQAVSGMVSQGGPLTRCGAWSVTWVGGFAVISNIQQLVELVSDDECVYPHAKWFGYPEHAALWAQREYSERYVKCFDVRDFYPVMPSSPVGMDRKFISGKADVKPSDSATFKKLKEMGLL